MTKSALCRTVAMELHAIAKHMYGLYNDDFEILEVWGDSSDWCIYWTPDDGAWSGVIIPYGTEAKIEFVKAEIPADASSAQIAQAVLDAHTAFRRSREPAFSSS